MCHLSGVARTVIIVNYNCKSTIIDTDAFVIDYNVVFITCMHTFNSVFGEDDAGLISVQKNWHEKYQVLGQIKLHTGFLQRQTKSHC